MISLGVRQMKKAIKKVLDLLKSILRPIKKKCLEIRNFSRVKKASHHHQKTHIVFLCQFESCWDKFKPLFEDLIRKNKKTTLLIINDDNSTLPYYQKTFTNKITIFEREYPEYCVKYEKGILKKLKPSYVVYTRPYNHYLPTDLRSFNALKYSKTAFINYYYPIDCVFSLIQDILPTINLFIAGNTGEKNFFDQICSRGVSKGYQKAIDYGFPQFENLYADIGQESDFRQNDRIKVIWTPRWLDDDSELGGSNFLRYHQKLLDFFIDNDSYSLIFRPHPLMFNDLIQKGKFTQEEKNKVIHRIKESENCVYDESSYYFHNFKNSNILITDYSSVIPEYFLTYNPIIYCEKNHNYNIFDDTTKEMIDCNYRVSNIDELLSSLKDITHTDSKKSAREKQIRKFMSKQEHSSQRIVEELTDKD